MKGKPSLLGFVVILTASSWLAISTAAQEAPDKQVPESEPEEMPWQLTVHRDPGSGQVLQAVASRLLREDEDIANVLYSASYQSEDDESTLVTVTRRRISGIVPASKWSVARNDLAAQIYYDIEGSPKTIFIQGLASPAAPDSNNFAVELNFNPNGALLNWGLLEYRNDQYVRVKEQPELTQLPAITAFFPGIEGIAYKAPRIDEDLLLSLLCFAPQAEWERDCPFAK